MPMDNKYNSIFTGKATIWFIELKKDNIKK